MRYISRILDLPPRYENKSYDCNMVEIEREKTKQKQLELEIKKLEYEMMKLKNNVQKLL